MKKKPEKDIEKGYPVHQMAAKLRRLADCLEHGKTLSIQIHGERITVPKHAVCNIEHEREGKSEEVEFQLKWKNR